MLFTVDKEKTKQELQIDAVKIIRNFYIQNSCLELLVNVANMLRESHYLLIVADKGIALPCDYLADCLVYLNTGLEEMSRGKLSINKRKFFQGNLPVNRKPKVELTPRQVIRYVIEAMEKSPTGELNAIIPFMRDFQTIFESNKIRNALELIIE